MMKRVKIIVFFICCTVIMGIAGQGFPASDNFPTKPINLYVGWGAGGGVSMMARVVSSKAGEILGAPIVVMNKPGGGGTIANDFVHRAKPDGYSLTVATLANNGSALLLNKQPYTISDFEYLGMFAHLPMILFVSSESPWKTLEQLINYAKEHPGDLKYSSNGVGASAHISTAWFCSESNIQAVHLPMKSDSEVLSSILGGYSQMSMGFLTTILPVKEGGKVRFLATASEKRLEWFPEVPTFREKGFSVVYNPWYGIAAPRGLPKEVSGKLQDAFAKTFQDAEVREMLKKLGCDPMYKSSEEFTKFVNSEFKKLHEVFKKIGLPIVQ
jgi:tripartite-type tricarboxylate transporter receptor subunit TctC